MTYRYQVLCDRRFIGGCLEGTHQAYSVPFATWKAAEDFRQWAENHRKDPVKPCAGSEPYVFDCIILEAI